MKIDKTVHYATKEATQQDIAWLERDTNVLSLCGIMTGREFCRGAHWLSPHPDVDWTGQLNHVDNEKVNCEVCLLLRMAP